MMGGHPDGRMPCRRPENQSTTPLLDNQWEKDLEEDLHPKTKDYQWQATNGWLSLGDNDL